MSSESRKIFNFAVLYLKQPFLCSIVLCITWISIVCHPLTTMISNHSLNIFLENKFILIKWMYFKLICLLLFKWGIQLESVITQYSNHYDRRGSVNYEFKSCCICVLFSLLAGCASESSIDEKRKKSPAQSNINKNTPSNWQTKIYSVMKPLRPYPKRIFKLSLMWSSAFPFSCNTCSIRQPRTGNHYAGGDAIKIYTVSTFPGIPTGKFLTCNKTKIKRTRMFMLRMNWMQALRFRLQKDTRLLFGYVADRKIWLCAEINSMVRL